MPIDQGSFDKPLDVTRSRTIQGALTAGGTVRTGATLTVQGAVDGEITVEPDAILSIQGVFGGRLQNQGTVLLAGVVTADVETLNGRVAVAAESLISVAGRIAILNNDGSMTAVEGDVPALNTGRNYLALLPDGSFTPVGNQTD